MLKVWHPFINMKKEKLKTKMYDLVDAGDSAALAKLLRKHPADECLLSNAFARAKNEDKPSLEVLRVLVDAGADPTDALNRIPYLASQDPAILEWILPLLPDDGTRGEGALRAAASLDDENVQALVAKSVRFSTKCKGQLRFSERLLGIQNSARAIKLARLMIANGDEIDFNSTDGSDKPLSFALVGVADDQRPYDCWSLGRRTLESWELHLKRDGLLAVFKAFEDKIDFSVIHDGRSLATLAARVFRCKGCEEESVADFIALRAFKAGAMPEKGMESWMTALALVKAECKEALRHLGGQRELKDAMGRPLWRVLLEESLKIKNANWIFLTLNAANVVPDRAELAEWLLTDEIKEFWLTGKDADPTQVVVILRHLSEGSVGDAAAGLAADALAKCGSLESSSEIPWLLRKMAGRPVQDGDENLS